MDAFPRTALAIGQAIQNGDIDPVALTQHCLDDATASDAVFISLTPDRALAEAEAAARRRQLGIPQGPLDGVPLAWKDLFDITGTLTTAGSRVLAKAPATRDATAVRHASGNGMVCIGKTNLTELAYSGLGLNPHYGTPHHTPAGSDPRVPGGSSSGSAVAVAKGIVPAAIGTDTAGSLRIPAAFNGLVSYRPSQPRHDRHGVTPLAETFDTIGAIAPSLSDCLAIDDLLRGKKVQTREPADPGRTVIVLDTTCLDDERLEPGVRQNLENSAERLAQAGFHVIRRPIASVGETLNLIQGHGWLGAAEAYTEYRGLLERDEADRMDPRVRQRLLAARSMTPDSVVTLYHQRQALQNRLRQDLAGAILLTPTVAHAAPFLRPLESDSEYFAEINLATLRLSMVASLLDSPAIAMPSGVDENQQHTSMQLSAPSGGDEILLRVALAADEYLGADQ
ncbi:aspartyl-tRNA(Asn)/glutamyl-tRNA(Gln) amidotransferase subunit A [Chromohalobacter canadensis]|uniref:Aspartyl-tRNA(Asn)/glutamyl-tRNA(Gln) amidotransferase subunit A n=1 Tax=Chromohalobacter canadensis TaxID=141389 RepID=A0A285VKU8_9GAMM|nr:amidase family protein [Chromohalobacter canadensis]SOC54705.1 aspartyl-tRNA(Asn)/glutamyl-tRNA(Gln) amidotransferase subunit A [Chromohalobacter canadensis]